MNIDTTAPTTKAYAVAAKHNKKVNLRYRVNDAKPGCGGATVTLKIYKGSKLKKTLSLGKHATNVTLAFHWKCTLAKGSYTIKVYATDLAGNKQSKVGSAKLKVK